MEYLRNTPAAHPVACSAVNLVAQSATRTAISIWRTLRRTRQVFVESLLYGAPRQIMLENDYVQRGAYQAGKPATHTGTFTLAVAGTDSASKSGHVALYT